MKIIYLLVMFAFLQPAKAQDFCKLIKIEAFPDRISFEYNSPYDPDDKTAMHVTRSYSKDPENTYDNFYIMFQMIGELDDVFVKTATGGQNEKEEKTLIVEFSDKSKIVDDTIRVNHDFTDDRTQATRYVYYPITEGNVKDFTSKKIEKFKLAGYEQVVHPDSANAMMHYIQCLKAIKK
jgi:hypothetical protein